jgi:hypothetical protein
MPAAAGFIFLSHAGVLRAGYSPSRAGAGTRLSAPGAEPLTCVHGTHGGPGDGTPPAAPRPACRRRPWRAAGAGLAAARGRVLPRPGRLCRHAPGLGPPGRWARLGLGAAGLAWVLLAAPGARLAVRGRVLPAVPGLAGRCAAGPGCARPGPPGLAAAAPPGAWVLPRRLAAVRAWLAWLAWLAPLGAPGRCAGRCAAPGRAMAPGNLHDHRRRPVRGAPV